MPLSISFSTANHQRSPPGLPKIPGEDFQATIAFHEEAIFQGQRVWSPWEQRT